MADGDGFHGQIVGCSRRTARLDGRLGVLGDAQLRTIARELVKSVRESVTIDWNLRKSVRAGIQLIIKRILRRHKNRPDKTEKVMEQALQEAELFTYQAA